MLLLFKSAKRIIHLDEYLNENDRAKLNNSKQSESKSEELL